MKHEVHEGSGEIFAGIGPSNPEERLAKARVALRVQQLIEQTSLT